RVIALEAGMEERAVLSDGPAQGPAVEVVMRVGLGAALRPCPLGFVARFLVEVQAALGPPWPGLSEESTVPGIGARLRRGVEDASARPTYFGVVGRNLHANLLGRLQRRDDRRPVPHVSDRHAVQRVVVR